MHLPEIKTVKSVDSLRKRVERLFVDESRHFVNKAQLTFDAFESNYIYGAQAQSLSTFIDFVADAIPDGDVFLFGGVLRDLALLGREGFNSDIDIVVEGDWSGFIRYLESRKAVQNKFGGFRLVVAGWQVDIWNAKETWAIRQGYVTYNGIASLTKTTVLNWDAILMNWRTGFFVHSPKYFDDIEKRALDIVLEENPNPLGLTVRVLRHLCLKDARQISPRAARYMAELAKVYSFEQIREAEHKSYRNNVIDPRWHRFFESIEPADDEGIRHQFSLMSDEIKKQLSLC